MRPRASGRSRRGAPRSRPGRERRRFRSRASRPRTSFEHRFRDRGGRDRRPRRPCGQRTLDAGEGDIRAHSRCVRRDRGRRAAGPARQRPHAVEAKIGLVPEDRRREGLVGNRSLAENIALTDLAGLSLGHGFGPMATGRIASLFARYRSDLSLMCRGPSRSPRSFREATSKRSCSRSGWRRAPGCSSSTSRHRGSTSMRSATCAT